MKHHPLWHLLSTYIVEHTPISLIVTYHCIRPRLQDPNDGIVDFASVWQKAEFMLAGNCVYVGLLLIPRKKQNLTTHKKQPAAETIGCGRMNATESNCVLLLWDSDFLLICFYLKYLQCYISHIDQWGIAPTGKLLVTGASEMLHTSSLGDGIGVQKLQGRGCEIVDLLILSRIVIFVYVKCSFSQVAKDTPTTQLHKHTTTKEPLLPTLQRLFPSLSMSRAVVPPTHGTAASYKLTQGGRHQVWRRCCWFPCLERQHKPHQK